MPTQSTRQTAFWGIYRLWNRLSNRHCETWSRGKNVPRESPKSPEIRIHSRQREMNWDRQTLTSKRVKYMVVCVWLEHRYFILHSPSAAQAVPRRNVECAQTERQTQQDMILTGYICTSKPNAFHIKWNLGRVANGKSGWMGICGQLNQLDTWCFFENF